jgi:hypothetical protein
VLGPVEETTFKCPVRRKDVNWEAKDVFNPAAVVKDNKVYLLYRAEDRVRACLLLLFAPPCFMFLIFEPLLYALYSSNDHVCSLPHSSEPTRAPLALVLLGVTTVTILSTA